MLTQNKKLIKFFKLTTISFLFLVVVFCFFGLAQTAVFAQTTNTGVQQEIDQSLQTISQETGLQNSDPRIIVGRIIQIFLGFLGVVALGIVLYAGWLYMTAGGEADKVNIAKKWLINGFIGLVIILSAYSITAFIIGVLTNQNIDSSRYNATGLASGYSLSGGAFGTVIQSHFPTPEQKNVPRNTAIMVTFREEVDPASLIDGDYTGCPANVTCGAINKDNFKVFACSDMPTWQTEFTEGEARKLDQCLDLQVEDPASTDALIDGYIMVTQDNKTVIFNPYGDDEALHLGSLEEDVSYVVHLDSGITKLNSDNSIFTISNPDYKWRFTTGTFIDLTPPRITSVAPKPEAGIMENPSYNYNLDKTGKVYLNQIVVVNFNEPVIPPLRQEQDCSVGDETNSAQILNDSILDTCTTKHIPGYWQVGINGYRTIQFITNLQCDGVQQNSCGEPVYCLPANSTISNRILASVPNQMGTGISDLAGNSLDGNNNNEIDGPGDPINWPDVEPTYDYNETPELLADNYYWRFATGNSLDLTPPYITQLEPDNAEGGLNVDQNLFISFSEELSPYSVDTGIKIFGDEGDGKSFAGWFDPNFNDIEINSLDAQGNIIYEDKEETIPRKIIDVEMDKVKLSHGNFAPYVIGEPIPIYMPIVSSVVKDLRQNCFNPAKEDSYPTGHEQEGTGGVANSTCNSIDSSDTGTSCCPADYQYNLTPRQNEAACVLPATGQ